MLPIDSVASAETKTNYCYFSPDDEINKNATSKENMLISKCDTPRTDLSLNYLPGAEKVNTVKVSKSNYFNAC
jgi:hypothetical protein